VWLRKKVARRAGADELTAVDDLLQERAERYVSGAMTPLEREALEVLIEYDAELRTHIAGLQDVTAGLALVQATPLIAPPENLKERLFSAIDALPADAQAPEALVVTSREGVVEWVNPAFTAMCGYELPELRGRKPGDLLQGPATESAAVNRIRAAIRAREACRETLTNYHKDGTCYRAEVRILPVLDDAGAPLWFVARERKLMSGESALAGAMQP
jgi:PAS domain S-box-containing protein